MEEIHFYLKKAGKDGKSLIVLKMNYHKVHRLLISFNEHIAPDQWDDKRDLPRKSYKHYHTLKKTIEGWKDTTESVFKAFKADRILPSVPLLRETIKDKMKPSVHSGGITLQK